ncbi:MAG: nucleotidyltransferase domain-containing protein [Deltaproteobacteria bacterium]|nr:nucleotidyltransferase domain-containing protein [Deltaproteobacteria bacterium]
MDKATEDILKEITHVIVEAVNPFKIILFGSHARGNAAPGSDLDFLIIEEYPFDPSRSRRKEIGDIHRLLKHVRMPMDILVYSKQEFYKWIGAKNHVIAHAAKEGRILYERT